MPTENATYISELTPGSPAGQGPIAEGDDELRQLKTVLQAQFPNLGALAVTPTAQQLNTMDGLATTTSLEDRISKLEDLIILQDLPAQAYDFNNSWWTEGPDVVPERTWFGVARKDEYFNVPWQWGTDITPGQEGDTTVTLTTRIVGAKGGMSYNQVLYLSGTSSTLQFWRAHPDSNFIVGAQWHGFEYSDYPHTEGNLGQPTATTVCNVISQLCP